MLLSMFSTLPPKVKKSWSDQVSTMVHVYNCTKSNATGLSHYFLLYGRPLMLPIDIVFSVRTPDLESNTAE